MSVDDCVRDNTPWLQLPKHVRQLLGNSQREYDKMVVEYSVKHQLRHKGNLVRQVRKNEEEYYKLLMKYSREHFMLFPYHLSDIVIRGLRMTPFQYYLAMMRDLMAAEKSYDSLPNFTAADCLRLMGIGRNQYIELMNSCRSNARMFRKRPDLLPSCPIQVLIEPWWVGKVGSILEADMKSCTTDEKSLIDRLIDEKGCVAGTCDAPLLQVLYQRGYVYFDAPVDDDDTLIVPPLESFVMNRVLGDYFETLLYKIFVSIDEHTTIAELADILQIDLTLVKNAVSVFCRLGIAYKRSSAHTSTSNDGLHVSWLTHGNYVKRHASTAHSPQVLTAVLNEELDMLADAVDEIDNTSLTDIEVPPTSSHVTSPTSPHGGQECTGRRIGFLFDSTLTAFLMMGNLSQSLKTHAVTLFEVGKLADEALDNFVDELAKVKSFGEGEAARYFEHAQTLQSTIVRLRACNELDLLRCESLHALDVDSRTRVLRKNYQLLVCMAPLSPDVEPIVSSAPVMLGPPIAAANSAWLRLFLYDTLGEGPTSLLLTRGTRVRQIPLSLRQTNSDHLLLSTWSHEPGLVPMDSCLLMVNDSLMNSCVMLQAVGDGEVVHVPFPLLPDEIAAEDAEWASTGPLTSHPCVRRLNTQLRLSSTCGYVTLVRSCARSDGEGERRSQSHGPMRLDLVAQAQAQNDPRKAPMNSEALTKMDHEYNEWTLYDYVFGIPLFDKDLNSAIIERVHKVRLFDSDKRCQIQHANRLIGEQLHAFIQRFQPADSAATIAQPCASLIFQGSTVTRY